MRHLWWEANRHAQSIVESFSKLESKLGIKRVEIVGSVRRKLETVGNLDILIAALQPSPILEWFLKQPYIESILKKEEDRVSVKIKPEFIVNVTIVPEESFGFAQLYFTGSQEHVSKVIALCEETCPSFSDEKQIYKTLGLAYIAPELREDRGEIEAAQNGSLPHLIEESDIRGIFHCHTTDSDGHNSLEEMVAEAEKKGWEYIGITDHSKSSHLAHGMNEERLFAQIERITELNAKKIYSPHIFAGVECDILADGSLDFPDSILKQLDFVVVSLHSFWTMDEHAMTKRLIKAIENPYSRIIGHLTGRLLLKREPYALNIPKVIDAAIANHKIIELNGFPNRLDMDWRYWHQASERGLLCCINPDAHRVTDLDYYKSGVNSARKGWLEKKDVLNTRSLEEIKKTFLHGS